MPPRPPSTSFALADDGARIAWRQAGRGPLLIQAAAWMGHLDHDADGPMAGAAMQGLAAQHRVVRYDARGSGLSDRLSPSSAFEDWLHDLERVARAATMPGDAPRCAVLGVSQGAAVAIAYAARHPQRVSRLVLHGGFARGALVRDGSEAASTEATMLARLAELGWGRADAAFRQVFTTQLMPDASHAQQAQFNEMQRLAASPEHAAQLMRGFDRIDVAALLPRVRCPVLVLHSRDDARVPFDEGRFLAGGLADAEFVSLPSRNHLLLSTEPAWPRWLAHVREFLSRDVAERNHAQVWSLLTQRQRGLTELMAQGCGNGQIARRLGLSERTVRNHLSTIFDRLEVENRSQAIVRLRDSGFGAARV